MPDVFDNCPRLPVIISKIATEQAGGWKISLIVPETAAEIVRQLVGTENKRVYTCGLADCGELPAEPKRGPGRPKG